MKLTNDEIKRVAEEFGAITTDGKFVLLTPDELLAFAQHFYKKGQDEQQLAFPTSVYSQCSRHIGQKYIVRFTTRAMSGISVCPNCEQERNASPESDIDQLTYLTQEALHSL